jgi:hypothetical protein
MKKLLLLLLFVLKLSCNSSDDETEQCQCTKETYKRTTETVFDSNGLPHLVFGIDTLSTEIVNCQDEQQDVSLGNQIYFSIVCD